MKAPVKQSLAHDVKYTVGPPFYITFTLMMGNIGTLLCLNRIMVTNIHEAFDHMIEGIDVIIM